MNNRFSYLRLTYGTAGYYAPEILDPEWPFGKYNVLLSALPTDMYSLGMTMLTALLGSNPLVKEGKRKETLKKNRDHQFCLQEILDLTDDYFVSKLLMTMLHTNQSIRTTSSLVVASLHHIKYTTSVFKLNGAVPGEW